MWPLRMLGSTDSASPPAPDAAGAECCPGRLQARMCLFFPFGSTILWISSGTAETVESSCAVLSTLSFLEMPALMFF